MGNAVVTKTSAVDENSSTVVTFEVHEAHEDEERAPQAAARALPPERQPACAP